MRQRMKEAHGAGASEFHGRLCGELAADSAGLADAHPLPEERAALTARRLSPIFSRGDALQPVLCLVFKTSGWLRGHR